MRILHISYENVLPDFQTGGQGVAVWNIARQQVKAGHEVRVMCPDKQRTGTVEGVKIVPLVTRMAITGEDVADRMIAGMENLGLLWSVTKEFKPDIIHGHEWSAAEVFMKAKQLEIPLCVTMHLSLFHNLQYIRKMWDKLCSYHIWWEQEMCREADGVIAISDYYEHIIKGRHPKGLVRRIYNGVQPEDFEGETVEIDTDKIIAFFHGRLVAQKGIALIAEAARRDKNILFVIAGGCSVEPDHAPLAVDIDELKSNALKDNVLMLGRISQPLIGAYLRKADVAIYPHYRAPFDLAVLEAMACGTPTICTATDALLEYSTHNVNAYHIPEPPTVENLLKAIYAVAGDSELKKRISEGGKKKGQEMGWQRAAQQTVEFYKEIIDGYKV